jgi:hypothetical protein
MNQPPSLTVDLSARVRSLSLDKAELRTLLEKLQERCLAAGDIEVTYYQPSGRALEAVEEDKKKLKEGFKLYLTVTGADGVKLNGAIDTIFDSPNFPSAVRSVFFDSSVPLKAQHNYTPRNLCILFLDFSRPEVLNFTFLPSQETPNGSNIAVQGSDATWVHGVYHEFDQFISSHSSTVQWLHRHSVYDLLVWIFGLPLSFWCCFRVSGLVQRLYASPFLQAAGYTYLFFGVLFGFRILFHYARWIWPLVEFRHPGDSALRHKIVWSTIAGGLAVSLLYDLLKAL